MNMFTKIPIQRPKKAKFNPSHRVKGTCNLGYLIPVFSKDVLPGDSWQMDSGLMARISPLVAPMMHEVDIKLYSFYTPYRLVWDEFKDYITKGRLGTTEPVHPYITYSDATKHRFVPGELADYLDLQMKIQADPLDPVTNVRGFSALPFRVYLNIWNEYFLNDNLNQPPIPFSKGSGDATGDFSALTSLRLRQWEADRYVSALPFAQRGDAVIMPVDVTLTYKPISDIYAEDGTEPGGGGVVGTQPLDPGNLTKMIVGANATPEIDGGEFGRVENIDSIEGTSLNINEFREALALQKWMENNARGGSKYVDQLLVRWGVKSSDARLQRPEYLGGASAPLVISEVLSTVQFEGATDDLPQGNMSGHGIGVGSSNGFRRYFEEHGLIMTLMCIIPRTGYMQGVDKKFTRFDALDWANPEFANLGEEQILRQELYFDPEGAVDSGNTLFGYTPRFSDYKFFPSTAHGEMRTTLKHWTMNREFDSPPELNMDFVECNPTYRVFAVEDSSVHHVYYQIDHRISILRSLPYYGMPGKMTV